MTFAPFPSALLQIHRKGDDSVRSCECQGWICGCVAGFEQSEFAIRTLRARYVPPENMILQEGHADKIRLPNVKDLDSDISQDESCDVRS